MPRSIRPNLPGVPFHLASRVQGRAALFVGLEQLVLDSIRTHTSASDGELLAYAVMPTHLHLVFVQGERPLWDLMQPLLRDIALRVHEDRRCRGHVFERRYRSLPVLTARHLRSAIRYVHLNPFKARLCAALDAYPWTSHSSYLHAAPEITTGLRLFGTHADYARFVRAGLLRLSRHTTSMRRVRPQEFQRGDVYWAERFGDACRRAPQRFRVTPQAALHDIAAMTIAELAPDMPLYLVRSADKRRVVVNVRRAFIRRAREQQYTTAEIAVYLNVSDSAVSAA